MYITDKEVYYMFRELYQERVFTMKCIYSMKMVYGILLKNKFKIPWKLLMSLIKY